MSNFSSAELRFEFNFSGRDNVSEELFSAADELQSNVNKLSDFEGKYQGVAFRDRCSKLLEYSQDLDEVDRAIKDLTERKKIIKHNLTVLNKEMEATGCKGIKSSLVKIKENSKKVQQLSACCDLDLESFPVLKSLVNFRFI